MLHPIFLHTKNVYTLNVKYIQKHTFQPKAYLNSISINIVLFLMKFNLAETKKKLAAKAIKDKQDKDELEKLTKELNDVVDSWKSSGVGDSPSGVSK